MAYVALYRQWRPQDFDALVGQKAVKTTLKNALASGKIAHAYLFSGPRGTGKTSMARILAKALNCEQGPTAEPCGQCGNCQRIVQGTSLDVIEIDAASNTSVDNIRDLREQVAFTPAESRYKVYIIDEVHMLSTGAFNALLKTLEEPPAHAVFILATTDPQKVPATIQSRCQRFEFRRVTVDEIAEHLAMVAAGSGIEADADALRLIAIQAEGGMRDALSLLDQCASAVSGELTAERVYACLGIAGERRCAELLDKIARQDTAGAMQLFNRLYTEGKDLSAMLDELASLVRDVLILKTAPEAGITMLSGVAEDGETRALASRISGGELIRMMELLQKTLNLFTRSASRRTDAELCILEMSQPELSQDLSSMNARLTRVEEQLKTGAFVMPQRAAPAPQEKTEAEPEPSDESGASQPEPEPVREVNEELPMGFWQDLAAAVRKELYPPVSGFFTATPNGPMEVEVSGSVLTLRCQDSFTAEIVGKEDILQVVSRKASVLLGKPVKAKVTDLSKQGRDGAGMSKLMRFGRANPDIVRIKEN